MAVTEKKVRNKDPIDFNTCTNAVYAANNQAFVTACEDAGLKPTKRQASKYRLGKGIVFKKKGA